jgi:RNA polymerase sigma factor (sigma-70 family)
LLEIQSFEDHVGLLKSIVHSFDRSCPPEDSEIFPVACMGLMKAIATFDPDRSKFSYWATKIIRNLILGEKRKDRLRFVPMSPSGEESIPDHRDDSGLPLDLTSLLVDPASSDTPSELEQKRILRRHFVDQVSMAEIAREVGLTREGVRQKMKRAIESVREKHREVLDNHPLWLAGKVRASEV